MPDFPDSADSSPVTAPPPSVSPVSPDTPISTPQAAPMSEVTPVAGAPTANAIPLGMPRPAAPAGPVVPAPSPQYHKDSLLGKAARAIMGGPAPINPATGQPTRRPGDLARHILAGALLGAAASSDQVHSGNGLAAAGVGFKAARDADLQQDALRRHQTQQTFENQLKLNEQKRAQQELDINQKRADQEAADHPARMELLKYQTAHFQQQVLNEVAESQNKSYDFHKERADDGQKALADYKSSGLKPYAENIPETQALEMIKTDPNTAHVRWEPTGVVSHIGPNGEPSYQYTFTAYNVGDPVTPSASTIAEWKKNGVDQRPGASGLFDVVKAGKPLTAQQYVGLEQQNQIAKAQKDAAKSVEQKQTETDAKIREYNANAARSLAEAAHARTESAHVAHEENRSALQDKENKSLDSAFDKASKDGDNRNFTPDESRAMTKFSEGKLKEINQSLATLAKDSAVNDPSSPIHKSYIDTLEEQSKWRQMSSLSKPEPMTTVYVNGKAGQIPASKVKDFIANTKGAALTPQGTAAAPAPVAQPAKPTPAYLGNGQAVGLRPQTPAPPSGPSTVDTFQPIINTELESKTPVPQIRALIQNNVKDAGERKQLLSYLDERASVYANTQ